MSVHHADIYTSRRGSWATCRCGWTSTQVEGGAGGASIAWAMHIRDCEEEVRRGIEFLDERMIDRYGVVTLGTWGGYLIQIMPMIFNDRVVMTPALCADIYDYGWCYPKGGAAHHAVMAWNPATQAEPAGYIKAIAPGRRADERAPTLGSVQAQHLLATEMNNVT